MMNLTQVQRFEIARAIQEKRETVQSAAERYNKSKSTIYKWLEKFEAEQARAQKNKKISSFFAPRPAAGAASPPPVVPELLARPPALAPTPRTPNAANVPTLSTPIRAQSPASLDEDEDDDDFPLSSQDFGTELDSIASSPPVFSSQEQTPRASQTAAPGRNPRPILKARRHSSTAIAKNLTQDFDRARTPSPVLSELYRACSIGNAKTVRILLHRNYASSLEPDANNTLPGMVALRSNHYLVVLEIFFAAVIHNDFPHAQNIIKAFPPITELSRRLSQAEIETAALELIDLYLREYNLGRWQTETQTYESRDAALGNSAAPQQEQIKQDKLALIQRMIAVWIPTLQRATPDELKEYYKAAVDRRREYPSFDLSENSDSEDEEYFSGNATPQNPKRQKRLENFQRMQSYHDDEFWLRTRRTTPRRAGLIDKIKILLESEAELTEAAIKSIQDGFVKNLEQRATLQPAEDAIEYVALFRGNNYMFDRWSNSARRYHYYLDEVGSPQFSETALKNLPYDFYRELNDANCFLHPELKTTLLETTTGMQEAYLGFTRTHYTDADTVAPNKQAPFMFQSESDRLQHEFSNGINEHLLNMRDRIKADPERWSACFINAYNYAVATSTRPYHGGKYATGLKEYYADAFPLRYNHDGSLLNSHAGKIVLFLCTSAEFRAGAHLNRVVKKNYAGQVPIGTRILPELETSYIGRTPDVIYQQEVKFPSFDKPYKTIYEIKYGLNKKLYTQFQKLIQNTPLESPERKAVITLLKEWICAYLEVLLLSIACEEAANGAPGRPAGKLVYVNHEDDAVFVPDKNPKTKGDENAPARNRTNVLENLRYVLADKAYLMHKFSAIRGCRGFCENSNPETLGPFLKGAINNQSFLTAVAHIRVATSNIIYEELEEIIKNNIHTFGLPQGYLD